MGDLAFHSGAQFRMQRRFKPRHKRAFDYHPARYSRVLAHAGTPIYHCKCDAPEISRPSLVKIINGMEDGRNDRCR
jgi:hypothetical protein